MGREAEQIVQIRGTVVDIRKDRIYRVGIVMISHLTTPFMFYRRSTAVGRAVLS